MEEWAYLPSDSGAYYYANLTTGATQWARPESLDTAAAPSRPVIPDQWVEHFDEESNLPYYHNESTGATTWVLPADEDDDDDGWEDAEEAVLLEEGDDDEQQLAAERRRDKNALRRRQIFEEILQTERVYVASLATLQKVYLDPLRMVASTPKAAIFSFEDIDAIFLNIDVIAKVNAQFLEELVAGGAASCADTFAANTKRFKGCYTRYVSNTDESQARLTRIRQLADKGNKAAVEQHRFMGIAKTHPDAKGQDLTSFLIKPVQKMVHYKLMLEQLLAHTDPGDPDEPKVAAALEAVCSLASAFNEDKRAAQDFQALRAVFAKFAEPDASRLRTELVSYERKLVKEGSLVKQRLSHRQRRSLFLFSDVLLYGQPTAKGVALKGRIALTNGARVESLPTTTEMPHALAIVARHGKGYTWVCESAEERDAWCAALRACIGGGMGAGGGGGSGGGSGGGGGGGGGGGAASSSTPREGEVVRAGILSLVAPKTAQQRIDACRRGGLLTKYNKADGKSELRWVVLQRHRDGGERVCWGDQKTRKCKSDAKLSNATGLMHGARSGNFFKAGSSKRDQDWQCFSLVFKERTLDFAATNLEQLMDWYLALAALVPTTIDPPALDEVGLRERLQSMGLGSATMKHFAEVETT
jgi:hypothetical protein